MLKNPTKNPILKRTRIKIQIQLKKPNENPGFEKPTPTNKIFSQLLF
jgi:hypothetical protein